MGKKVIHHHFSTYFHTSRRSCIEKKWPSSSAVEQHLGPRHSVERRRRIEIAAAAVPLSYQPARGVRRLTLLLHNHSGGPHHLLYTTQITGRRRCCCIASRHTTAGTIATYAYRRGHRRAVLDYCSAHQSCQGWPALCL
jgi:hypothetical protein